MVVVVVSPATSQLVTDVEQDTWAFESNIKCLTERSTTAKGLGRGYLLALKNRK